MNFAKHYPRIERELFHSAWFVLPSVHNTLVKTFKAHIEGAKADVSEMEDLLQLEANDLVTDPSIALINVEGIIGKRLSGLDIACGGCDLNNVSDAIDEAMANENVKTIVFYINSPGGTVTGVPELAEKISEISKVKNTIAYVDILCASAGYYLASQCNSILSAPSADLGSVGVYSLYLDETRALENEGLKVNAISAGKYKLSGASFKPMTDEERAMFQADVDKLYVAFKEAVTSKRNIKDEYLQGQCFTGEDLINFGFVDGFANSLDEVLFALDKQTNS